MPNTGKIRPEVSAKGLLLPWPLVFSIVLTVLAPMTVSFIVFAIKATTVANVVEDVRQNDKRQDVDIVNLKTDLAAEKGRRQ